MSAVDVLRHVSLCAGLTDEQLGALASCLGRRALAKGVFVFHKDGPGRALYIIESGRVRIFSLSDLGKEIFLSSYGPGEIFGEMSVLDGLPRSAGAVATEPTVVLTLRREDLLELLDLCPHLARNIMGVLTARLRATTRLAEHLAFLNVQSRVAARLLDLADDCGRPSGGPQIDLTQGEIANWVAASRESVNKALVGFRSQGLIGVQGHQITILDRRGLERQVRY